MKKRPLLGTENHTTTAPRSVSGDSPTDYTGLPKNTPKKIDKEKLKKLAHSIRKDMGDYTWLTDILEQVYQAKLSPHHARQAIIPHIEEAVRVAVVDELENLDTSWHSQIDRKKQERLAQLSPNTKEGE